VHTLASYVKNQVENGCLGYRTIQQRIVVIINLTRFLIVVAIYCCVEFGLGVPIPPEFYLLIVKPNETK